MRSARAWSQNRQEKDGLIRDAIRTSGDERLAVQGLLELGAKSLEVLEGGQGDRAKWEDVGCQALKTLAAWTRKLVPVRPRPC